MKKTSFLAILLAALVLAAGVVTKDSELIKSYVPVLLEQLQTMDTAVPEEMPPKAEAKTQEAVKTADDILAVTALDIGQGDSILVQMQGKNILIDSGDRQRSCQAADQAGRKSCRADRYADRYTSACRPYRRYESGAEQVSGKTCL